MLVTKQNNQNSEACYWSMAREPWPSTLFILPMLLVYEMGVVFHSSLAAHRNGADLWIRQVGNEVGWGAPFLVPILAPLCLLSWQLIAHRSWSCKLETILGMLAESLIFAMVLIFLGQLLALSFPMDISGEPEEAVTATTQLIAFLGAGLYEEMIFRMMLIPVVFIGLRLCRVPRLFSLILAIVASSWMFATAHYVGPLSMFSPQVLLNTTQTIVDNPDFWFSYVFRLIAGGLFGVVFCLRGFGIAVGSHVLYDVFVGIILMSAL
ncbi:CPBP family glutamic-type intramembrane protease [Thalassoglobus sp. JC818]|uniref:CPBP family glutamic-type intramembrane protease n=1 Tax=Thalassoglobus sp. JC818 TaxID=3232136 RepID=UPI00345A1BC6